MTSSVKQEAFITKKEMIAPDIYDMELKVSLREKAYPGQFVMLYTGDGSKLLGRPICIADSNDDLLRVVFRASGEGTRMIAAKDTGEGIFVEGPLGKGYPEDSEPGKNKILLAGGIGAPSLLFLAKKLKEAGEASHTTAILGYRDGSMNCFLKDDFEACKTEVIVATDDGSVGVHGNVLDALKEKGIKADIIYACGPMPMLRAVKAYAKEAGIPAYISLEEHMACGVGVCLGCVTKTTRVDEHSRVKNARVCTEGPVFEAEEVDI